MGWTSPGSVAHIHCRGYLGLYPPHLVSCKAVLDQSVGKELPAFALESFECVPGRGVAATLSGVKVYI